MSHGLILKITINSVQSFTILPDEVDVNGSYRRAYESVMRLFVGYRLKLILISGSELGYM